MDALVPAASEKALRLFAKQVRRGVVAQPVDDVLRIGVDLGTANIVIAVVDGANNPVAGAWAHSTVIRDGIVVDWMGTVAHVRRLLESIEQRLGHKFSCMSLDVPPGISAGNVQVMANVVTACGLDVGEVVDEPVAAARLLAVTDGCVIDIGHGTTGVSVLDGGQLVCSTDQATGGHHMTLVVAGRLGLEYEAAEKYKTNPANQEEVMGIVTPTLTKMATIARDAIVGFDPPVVYLVGGASLCLNAPEIFTQVLGRPVLRPVEPLFITPLGVPMTAAPTDSPQHSRKEARHG